MRLQKQKETSGPKKIKATSPSGFSFYYSVTDSDLDSPSYQNQLESAVSKSIYDGTSTPSLPTSFEE